MRFEKSQWALVTGASSGLGVEFARQLAAEGVNLMLTARREAPMQALAAALREAHKVEVAVEALDLAAANAAEMLEKRLADRAIAPDILINNAAFGVSDDFLDQDPARLRAMLNLNVVSLTELTYRFGRAMAARGRGRILLVASMAAYMPTPRLAAYGASKAFVLSLGEALNVELAGKVGVTVLSPGLMHTGFADAAGYTAPDAAASTALAPSHVARIGLKAMSEGRSSIVAGRMNRMMALATRLMSRHRQAKMILRMAR